MLSNPPAVVGVFMMGASAGAVVTYIKYKRLLKQLPGHQKQRMWQPSYSDCVENTHIRRHGRAD